MTTEEMKYFLEYLGKEMGYIDTDDYKYDLEEQMKFESIMHGALSLYRDGRIKKSKLEKVHEQFKNSINESDSERLKNIKNKALKILDYPEINDENAIEVYYKINELAEEYQKKRTIFGAMTIGVLEYYYHNNTLAENLKILSDGVLKDYYELLLIFDTIPDRNQILEAVNKELENRKDSENIKVK